MKEVKTVIEAIATTDYDKGTRHIESTIIGTTGEVIIELSRISITIFKNVSKRSGSSLEVIHSLYDMYLSDLINEYTEEDPKV